MREATSTGDHPSLSRFWYRQSYLQVLFAIAAGIGRALVYFLAVSTVALMIGLMVGNIVRPSAGISSDPVTIDTGMVAKYASKVRDQMIVGCVTPTIPTTLFRTLADSEILQVLFVATLDGPLLSRTIAQDFGEAK